MLDAKRLSRADLYRIVAADALLSNTITRDPLAAAHAHATAAVVAAGGEPSSADAAALRKTVQAWGTRPSEAAAVAREFLAYQARRHGASVVDLLKDVACKLDLNLAGARAVPLEELARTSGVGTEVSAAPTLPELRRLEPAAQVQLMATAMDAIARDEPCGFGTSSGHLDLDYNAWARPTIDGLLQRAGAQGKLTFAHNGTFFGPAVPAYKAPGRNPDLYRGAQPFARYIEAGAIDPVRNELHRVRAFFSDDVSTPALIGAVATVGSRAELAKAQPDLLRRGAYLFAGFSGAFTLSRLERALNENGRFTADERFTLYQTQGEALVLASAGLAHKGPWSGSWDAVSPRLDLIDDMARLADLRSRASLLPFAAKGLDAKAFDRLKDWKLRILTQHFESAIASIADIGSTTIKRDAAPTAGEIEFAHGALSDIDTMLVRAQRDHGVEIPVAWSAKVEELAPLRARVAQLRAFNPLRRSEPALPTAAA